MTQTATTPSQATADELETLNRVRSAGAALRQEIGKQIIGQHQTVEHMLICLLSGGHAFLVGVPGLAKTLLIRTLAKAMDLEFRRIQFTPDLMPADITGTEIIQEDQATGRREFRFARGPLFANIILADEINRTPPKTQSALLEAMQEHTVTVAGKTHPLHEPFFVLATQNPVEQEGTYPLPEAQLDRFMFCLMVDYPSSAEAVQILEATTTDAVAQIESVVSGEEIIEFQKVLRKIPTPKVALEYAVRLVEATRPAHSLATPEVKRFVRWGAGPRASQALVIAAKARAVLQGRFHVEIEDLKALALPILRHRLVLNYHAEAERITSDDLVGKLVQSIR